MRRLFVEDAAISDIAIKITNKEDINYLSDVLRMRPGDDLFVSDGTSRAFETRIESLSKTLIELLIIKECPFDYGYKTLITLYQGLTKGSKMDDVVRKSTELGVFRIVPVVTERSITGRDGGVPAVKAERWSRIAEEAARQSRRTVIPEVEKTVSFDVALASLKIEGYDRVIVLFELEEKNTLKDVLRNSIPECSKIAVFIGPEGGFEQEEIDRLISGGAEAVTVGETILRTETAGPAAIAMILYELEL